MTEPSLSLQRAIWGLLTSSPDLSPLIGNRVFDRVPPTATFPYVRIGSDSTLNENYTCSGDSARVNMTIDVFSRSQGKVEAKYICGAIRRALNDVSLVLEGYQLVSLLHSETRFIDDPDGLSTHGIMTFRALVDGEE